MALLLAHKPAALTRRNVEELCGSGPSGSTHRQCLVIPVKSEKFDEDIEVINKLAFSLPPDKKTFQGYQKLLSANDDDAEVPPTLVQTVYVFANDYKGKDVN